MARAGDNTNKKGRKTQINASEYPLAGIDRVATIF